MPHASAPIGIFDSGAGGLSVLTEVHRLLPGEDLIYYADSAHFPYGLQPAEAINARAAEVARELIALGAKLIVVACNTATSAAIAQLRARFTAPFVGMEPPLKPAVERTRSGIVALLVTPQTAAGEKLAALVGRYGEYATVRTIAAPNLAERVELGAIDDDETRALVRAYVAPASMEGADVLALGCTHYAFLRGVIAAEAGPAVEVIEPSAAVARQVERLLDEHGIRSPSTEGGSVRYLTSGDAAAFASVRARLRTAGWPIPEG